MRKLCIIILLFQSTLNIAQEFGSPDSKWIYNLSHDYGYTIVEFERDTIIDSGLFRKFQISTSQMLNGDTVTFSRPIYFNNVDGLVKYNTDGASQDTLLNLNAAPGDKWKIPHWRTTSNNRYIIDVVDTFRVEVKDRNLKAISYQLEVEGGTVHSFVDTIYEHFGFRHSFILPYDQIDSGIGGNIGGYPLCFSNDSMGTIEFEPTFFIGEIFPIECDVISKVSDISNEYSSMKVIPNPSVDFISIEGIKDNTSFEIINITGQRFIKGLYQKTVDISKLDPGMYFFTTGEKTVRFVKS